MESKKGISFVWRFAQTNKLAPSELPKCSKACTLHQLHSKLDVLQNTCLPNHDYHHVLPIFGAIVNKYVKNCSFNCIIYNGKPGWTCTFFPNKHKNSINYLYEVGWVSSTKYAMQIIRNEEDKGIHLYDDVGQFIPHHSTNAMVSIDY